MPDPHLAYTAAHWPMHASEADIARQKGRYDAGYGPVRAARWARMKELGLLPIDTPLSPPAENWETVADKAWEARCMEVYAAMVERMDQGIGRVIEELRASGRLENTLVLYLQDNGGCAENMGRNSNTDQVARAGIEPMGPPRRRPSLALGQGSGSSRALTALRIGARGSRRVFHTPPRFRAPAQEWRSRVLPRLSQPPA